MVIVVHAVGGGTDLVTIGTMLADVSIVAEDTSADMIAAAKASSVRCIKLASCNPAVLWR
jgi:hypothetical protein